jgi:hypothetical protein
MQAAPLPPAARRIGNLGCLRVASMKRVLLVRGSTHARVPLAVTTDAAAHPTFNLSGRLPMVTKVMKGLLYFQIWTGFTLWFSFSAIQPAAYAMVRRVRTSRPSTLCRLPCYKPIAIPQSDPPPSPPPAAAPPCPPSSPPSLSRTRR